jgi:bacillithiol biosynthesis cysteine-adding enzyme BshC
MPSDCISYQKSGYFSKLIVDYLDEKAILQPFYNRFPRLENFEAQIVEKQKNYNHSNRKTLVFQLEFQYKGLKTSSLTQKNIANLAFENTFTITTGHQLNLFTGPLYFLYKIISTINLTKELQAKYPSYNFVPIYWMATEDHDFEEINYFNFKGKKIRWNKETKGGVGRLSTDELNKIFEVFEKELDAGTNSNTLKDLFKNAYLNHSNLSEATRFLANELFGKYGLVILDADIPELKKAFVPYAKAELLNQNSFAEVTKTIEKLNDYGIQVKPREINLFYLDTNLRERIVYEDSKYQINNTAISFSEAEILIELENHPERFSPNVILRPLYQEVILPNLCYIGGGGEIAYWLELKSYFEKVSIPFPMLLVRNSVLLVTEKQVAKADKLKLSWHDLFLKQTDLRNNKVTEFSAFPINFSSQKSHLQLQFIALLELANQTAPSFLGAVKAQEAKQIKGLENLEKRLLKAQKQKYAFELERITALQNELFPNQSLQERQLNFSEFYLEFGDVLIEKLFKELKPLEQEFKIVIL